MSDLLTPPDIERLARQLGIPIAEVCRRAGVATSIFARWKAGKTEPNLENYRRIRDVVVAADSSEPPAASPKCKAKGPSAAGPSPRERAA